MKVKLHVMVATVLFYALFLPFSLVLFLLFSLLGAIRRPFLTKQQAIGMIRCYIKRYGQIALRVGFPWARVHYDDMGHEAPLPCLFICNHRSSSDPFFVAVLPGEGVQVVNIWPFKLPIYGFFARAAGYLSVRQMSTDTFLSLGKQVLDEGFSIVGFPEGTRSSTLKMGPFHGSMFRLALATKAPIVPVCISGNERIPPKGSLWIYPGQVRIRKLRSIEYPQYKEMSSFQLKNYVHDLIAQELAKMDGVT